MNGPICDLDAFAETEDERPVLVLRALGLGDALTAVPALRGLRRAYPRRPLLLAIGHPVGDLLKDAGVVDGVIPTSGLAGRPPGLGLGPHTAVNLHGRGPQSHILLQGGRPDELIAFASARAETDGPGWRDGEHEVDRWCRLVSTVTWAPCGRDDLRLPPPPPPQRREQLVRRPVVVHPGASVSDRRWPVDRWASVASWLHRAAGHDVVVTGGVQENALTAEVARRAGLPPTADLGGSLDIHELADLVARASLVLSADTGVAHLATAYGTASVILFGAVPPSEWGPAIDLERHGVLWCGSLTAISVSAVLDAAAALGPTRSPTDQAPSSAFTSAM